MTVSYPLIDLVNIHFHHKMVSISKNVRIRHCNCILHRFHHISRAMSLSLDQIHRNVVKICIQRNKDSFRSALTTFPFEIIAKFFSLIAANFSASNRPVLVFLSGPKVSGHWQKSKRNQMAADGRTKNFKGLAGF